MTVAARPAATPRPVAPGRDWRAPAVSALFWAGALALWHVYAQTVPAYQLPPPSIVFARMADFLSDPRLLSQLGVSLGHVGASVAASFVVGAALAAAPAALPATRMLVDDRLTPFLNAFSGIGWLFLAILWFGVNSATVIFAVTMVLTPFAIINLRTGLRELDRELLELGASLTRSRRRLVVALVLPMLLPYAFATLRTSFGVAWKVTLTAELFGGAGGVGYLLNRARQEFDTETIFAVILFIMLFVAFAERFAFRPVQHALDRRFRRD
ncbi:ABC transporter permease [Rubrimonas sp.]|uniref:ABC transporter permease n=1 Tax=Rubrimonas sp. TaxID=2036015 RepID=UPI002FDCA489